MLNQKGFTMVELMVAGVTGLALMAIIAAFLMTGSRISREVIQGGEGRENLYIALEMMRQDILHAGEGLNVITDPSTRPLVLSMSNPATGPNGYTQLFLSYGRFMRTESAPTTDLDSNGVEENLDPTYTGNPNLVDHKAWKTMGVVPTGTPLRLPSPNEGDPLYLSGSGYSVRRVASDPNSYVIRPYEIGFLIGVDGDIIALSPQISSGTGEFTGIFDFDGTVPTNGKNYVPAVGYQCSGCGTADSDLGSLVRNVPVGVAGDRKPVTVFGGGPSIRATGFRVRAQYKGEAAWRDGESGSVFDAANLQNLRVIEARVRYQVRIASGTWSPERNAIIRAAPRVLVLQ